MNTQFNINNKDYVNNLINFLPKPDILEPNEKKNFLIRKISSLIDSICTKLRRLKNRLFNDGIWYDEVKARQIVISYINDPASKIALRPYHQKIIEIYDRLAHLSKGKGSNWAEGIDRELLELEEDKEAAFEEETLIHELDNTLLENVLMPDVEEEVFESVQSTAENPVIDPLSASYHFNHHPLEALDNRYLFHIHADEFGSSSQLEGAQSAKVVNYLLSYLKKANENKNEEKTAYPQDLIEELANIVTVPSNDGESLPNKELSQAYIQLATNKIQETFRSNNPLLLTGGWIGKPSGHAIYYEIIPDSNGKATFRLYNTGAGIADSHLSAKAGNKIKYQSYCEWKNIDRERLESVYFLESLFELESYTSFSSENTTYQKNDIYQGLKNLLNVQDEASVSEFKIDPHLMMTPQRSGVCAWRSLMAFMRTKMELNDYKRFKCDIKLQSLIDYTRAHTDNIKPEEWRLVKKSHQKLCRSIGYLYQNKLIGDPYIQTAQTALQPISEWIYQHADCRYKRSIEPPAFDYTPCTKNEKFFYADSLDIPLEKIKDLAYANTVALQPCLHITDSLQQLNLNDPTQLETALKQATDLCQTAWSNREDLALHKGLIDIVSNLPIEEEFWNTAVSKKSDKAEALITSLGEISCLFTKSCFTVPQAHVIFPEKIYVFHKLLYLQQKICQLSGEKNSLKQNIVLNTPAEFNLFLVFSDAKMQKEMAIFNKAASWASNNQFFIKPDTTCYSNDVGFSLNFKKPENANKKNLFIDSIRKEYPQTIKNISQSEQGFEQLPSFSQDAHIYASERLPSWIKAMRDTSLANYYIQHSYVGSLASLDRNADIQIQFKIKDEENKSNVTMDLKGVTTTLFDLPEIDQITQQSYLRYAGQYPKPIEKSMPQLFQYLIKNNIPTEKTLSQIFSKDIPINMTNEELRELLRLFINTELQSLEVLEYFTKYPEKLKETDYQTLFHFLLFNRGDKDKSFETEMFAKKLFAFIQTNYEQLIEHNEIQSAVFLMKLSEQLNQFFLQEDFFYTTTSKLQKLLNRKDIGVEEKCLVYAELMAQLSHQKTLDEEEVALLLEGNIYLQENQKHSRYPEDPVTTKDVHHSLVTHAKQIQALLEQGQPNQQLLNRLLHNLRSPLSTDKEWTLKLKANEFPVFSTSDGEHTLYPLMAKLVSSEGVALLPAVIRNHATFRQLFPTIIQGSFSTGNVYKFNAVQGRKTLVHMEEDTLIIDQQFEDNQWYRHIPSHHFIYKEDEMISKDGTIYIEPETIKSQLGSLYLTHHYTYWRSLEKSENHTQTIYAIDSKTDQKQYRLTGKDSGKSLLERKGEQDRRKEAAKYKESNQKNNAKNSAWEQWVIDQAKSLSPDYTIDEMTCLEDGFKLGKPSGLLASFEYAGYIHEWYNEENKLKRIDLPRFGLSFRPDTQSEKLICEQFSSFSINLTDSIKTLGSYQHFILLENAKGQRKVLLPQQSLKAPQKHEVLAPLYKREEEKTEHSPQKYLVFDVVKNDRLFSKEREANLYLTQVLGAVQEYKKAAYYLRRYGEKLSLYTESEVKILKEISNTSQIAGDKSGNGVMLQLYADYLLIKNSSMNHKKANDSEIQALRDHYDLSLNHHKNITVFKLKPEEELYLLKILLEQQFDAKLFLRLKALDPTFARTLSIPPTQDPSENEVTKNEEFKTLENFFIPNIFKNKDFSEPTLPLLITRYEGNLIKYFHFFYELARTGQESERQRLKAALPFIQASENKTSIEIANLFEAILDNPLAFPAPIELDEKNSQSMQNSYYLLYDWKENVKTTALKQLSDKRNVSNKKIEERPTIDPRSFHSNKQSDDIPSVSLNYQLPPLPAFITSCEERQCFQQTNKQEEQIETEDLSQLLQTCDQTDHLQVKEANRLLNDLKDYQKQPIQPTYALNDQGLNQVIHLLSQDKDHDQALIQQLEKDILTLANKSPSHLVDLAQSQLKKWGGLRKVITLEELIVGFAHQDFTQFIQRNSSLEAAELNQLAEMIGHYLLYATRDQQRQRAEAILLKLETLNKQEGVNPQERTDLINQLAQEMLTTRFYNPQEKPVYLVFEYFANLSMRKTQVNKLEQFLNGQGSNQVMEMIMGSGKSKVLLPLLGLMRADGKALSMLIVPQPLFESVSQDTQTILKEAFSQSLRSLHFDRHTQFTEASLHIILSDLRSIQKNRECLIMTSKSVQCLVLKFIEESYTHFQTVGASTDLSEKLKTMQKILNLLKKNGVSIIDEADSVLNVLHEVSFSGGKSLSPDLTEIHILLELYRLIYQDESIRKMARLESDPTADETLATLTEPLYQEKIQTILIDHFIDRLGQMTFESKPLTQKLHLWIGQLNEGERIHLKNYLSRDKDSLQSAQAFYDKLDEEIQNVIAFAGEQLSHLLPYTLTRICDEKYGLDEDSTNPLAIPFSAAKKPSIGSQFSNPHITMNYTFQTYIKKGIPRKVIEEQIKLLQTKAMQEMAVSGSKIALQETIAGKAFFKLRGQASIPLFSYHPHHLDELVQEVNKNTAKKLDFVSQLLLPQMESFEKKMSCNPHNLAALFTTITGFTGTLWNGLSMHHTLKPEPEIGTDAKTLSLLWKNSRHNAISIQEGSTQSMLDQLKTAGIAYDMISDAGGYFKNETYAEIARQMAHVSGKKVAFYNKQGEQTLFNGQKDVPLTGLPEERLTFLDQSHTTGADVPQKRDAISLVTVGRHMLLRDLLQSVWRLRGLDKSQHVRFLVSDEVAGIIRQQLQLNENHPIQLENILKFVIANQTKQQGRDNYKALKQELNNLPQQMLLTALLHEKLTPQARLQAFSFLHSAWIKPAHFKAKALYGDLATYIKSERVLESDKNECKIKLQEMFSKMPWLKQIGIEADEYFARIEFLANHIKESLPAQLQTPSRAIEDDQTVEVERETEVETERETELEVQELIETKKFNLGQVFAKTPIIKRYGSFLDAKKLMDNKREETIKLENLKSFQLNEYPTFSLKSYLETDKDLSPYSSAFEGIDITMNVLNWQTNVSTIALNGKAQYSELSANEFTFLDPNRTSFHHLLIKDSVVTLITQKEAVNMVGNPDYYNLTLGYHDSDKIPSLDISLKILKIKFLNGESQFNLDEVKLLKQWFKFQGVAKMHKLYKEHILPGYPQKTMRYQNSPLQKLFAEMN